MCNFHVFIENQDFVSNFISYTECSLEMDTLGNHGLMEK